MLPILHVVFAQDGAACLRKALKAAGRDELVISLLDDLSFGPIDSGDLKERKRWVAEESGFTGWPSTPEDDGDRGWDEIEAAVEEFWSKSLSAQHRKVVWMSRRYAMEFAGFLEWLGRLGDEPCEVVDLTEAEISSRPLIGPPRRPFSAISIAGLFPDEIQGNNLWDLAEPLQIATRRRYHDLWRQLRAENAPLRVIDGDKLVSAPIDFFDRLLLSYAAANWRKVARVVGCAMGSQIDDRIFQAGDVVLAARVNALVEAGRLELQGKSAFAMRFSEVRLPMAP